MHAYLKKFQLIKKKTSKIQLFKCSERNIHFEKCPCPSKKSPKIRAANSIIFGQGRLA